MKSIDKLRTSLKACTKEAGIEPDKFDTYWITAKACDHLIDEIEAEIERDYMRLPRDVNDEVMHIGDIIAPVGEKPQEYNDIVQGVTDDNGIFLDIDESHYVVCDANKYYHVKPRTLEDVLVDMLEAAVGYSDAHTDVSLVAVEKYADEIRELLGFAIDEPDTIRNELLGGDEE